MDEPKPPSLNADDLRILMEANVQLIEILRDLEAFAAHLGENSDPELAARAEIVPLELTKGLLKPKRGKTDQFSFTIDSHGRQLGTGRTIDQATLDDLLAAAREMGSLLNRLHIELSELASAGLLPSTLEWTSIQAAETLLAAWTPSPFPNRDVANALATLRALSTALQDHREKLLSGLRLARILTIDANSAGVTVGLRALARYQPLGPIGRAEWSAKQFAADHPDYPDLTGVPLSSDLDNIDTWSALLAKQKGHHPSPPDGEIWSPWRSRLLKYFEPGRAGRIVSDITYDELLAAALGALPSALLSRSLTDVSPYDWSRLALHVLRERSNRKSGQPPLWALIAALRALDFDRDLLKKLIVSSSMIGPSNLEEERLAEAFLKGAKSAQAGILAVVDDSPGEARENATLIPVERRPTLYIGRSEIDQVVLGIGWLRSQGAFAGVLSENGQT